MFPATSISVLAVSSHSDQAVMTSTLGLWRNLGTVMGVAISSLIVQNGLIAYLDQYITGPNKIEVCLPLTLAVAILMRSDYSKCTKVGVDHSKVRWSPSARR